MHRPFVRFALPDGRIVMVEPGGIVGRASSASCRIADPRVSEAHALVSLRGRELHLLRLRGNLKVGGIDDDVDLQVGQHIELSEGVELVVADVVLPGEVLALCLQGDPPRELCAPVYSLTAGPSPELLAGFSNAAAARFWTTGDGWQIAVGGAAPERLLPGSRWNISGVEVEAILMDIGSAGVEATMTTGVGLPMTLVARHTSVHILRRNREPVIIDALPARILSEVALVGSPVGWDVVASEIWPTESDPIRLRQGWDRALSRLRRQLREQGLRENIVRSDGRGNVELFLLPGDRVVDEA